MFPEKELVHRLRSINNDKTCSNMLQCITNGAIVDVFAEVAHENLSEDCESDSEYQPQEEEESDSGKDDQVISFFSNNYCISL